MAIAIDIATGNIAVVGQHNGRIHAIQQHKQHIEHIDLAIAVHIAQNPILQRSFIRALLYSSTTMIHLINLPPEKSGFT